jgi:hypothetical protein
LGLSSIAGARQGRVTNRQKPAINHDTQRPAAT